MPKGWTRTPRDRMPPVLAASPGMGELEEEMLVNALLAFEAVSLILPSILFPDFSSHILFLVKAGSPLTPTGEHAGALA